MRNVPAVLILAFGAMAIAGYGGAAAQDRTTATYDEWTLACQADPGASTKTCDIAQVAQVQGKNIPFSRVAVLHPGRTALVRLTVQVPVNVSFAARVVIALGENDPGVAAPFARCTPGGCFADFDLKDDIVQKFRSASTQGKITYKDAGDHDIVIPLLMKGFGAAYDALAKS